MDKAYNEQLFERVNEFVSNEARGNSECQFMGTPFTEDDIEKAFKKINKGKAPGLDGVTIEHLLHSGYTMIRVMTLFYNHIIRIEYIPDIFRTGVQVPLYKWKNTCDLDPNNYRGITLLSIFNKVFEVLIWSRVSPWWEDNCVISKLQGACTKGHSCLHSALTIQEALATSLERHNKCFVTYFDVSKAFDVVWIEGLFFRLHKMGITGKTWRLLFLCYKNFRCKVRVQNSYSDWYPFRCGIHQGIFLSLIKYIAFIDSLIVQLAESGLCCVIYKIPASPIGYADDIATVCLSKIKVDEVLDKAYRHSCDWRYSFNPKKCAVLVYGEDRDTNKRNSALRQFKLGPHRIPEKTFYEHVGVISCVFEYDECVIAERLAKARKMFNALTGL